jgi:SAM-dependent methyltransferase
MIPPSSGAASDDDWDRHWAAYGESNALNPAQAYRRDLILARLDLGRAAGPVRLLEIGSGHGELSREMKRRHPEAQIVGLDLSPAGVEMARAKTPDVRFFVQDMMQPLTHPELRGWATHAVCTEVLEHLADPVTALRHARDVLAPGSRLVLTVPSGPMSAFDRHIGHLRHFSAGSLAATLDEAGFELTEVHGAGFPFFNLYRLAVIARGEALISDVSADEGGRPSRAARLGMQVFGWLFRFNSARTKWGWQLVAVATPRPSI